MALHTGQSTSFEDAIFFSSDNPLRNYVGQCTWYCWSKAHSKANAYPERNLKVDNLPTVDAYKWANIAKSNGFTIGDTPKKDSIAVWSNGSSGHVAYVEDYNSKTGEVCYSEANWYTAHTVSGNLYVDKDYLANIKQTVKTYNEKYKININVDCENTNGEKGTDGLFKNTSLSAFKEKKKSSKGFTCKFIYLN